MWKHSHVCAEPKFSSFKPPAPLALAAPTVDELKEQIAELERELATLLDPDTGNLVPGADIERGKELCAQIERLARLGEALERGQK